MMNRNIKLICIIDRTTFRKTMANPYNEILQSFFEVEYWDIRCLNKKWKKQYKDFRFEDDYLYCVKYIDSIQILKENILSLKLSGRNSTFLFTGSINYWNRKVLHILEKNKIPYFIKRNTRSFIDGDVFRKLAFKNITSLRKKIINYFYRAVLESKIIQRKLEGPALFFAGTNIELNNLNYPIVTQNIVFTHSKDYDIYLQTKNETRIIKEKYFVFIDQYFPFHTETAHLNINPKNFYYRVLSFLKNISDKTGMDFFIAVHPNSDLNILSNYLPFEKLYIGKTIPLIRSADFCITLNSSTALASIITNTPIILLDYNELLPVQFEPYTKKLEEIFKIKALKYNEDFSEEYLHKLLNEGKLNSKKLFEKYIKHPGTEDKLEYEIISENIIKYFNKKGSSQV